MTITSLFPSQMTNAPLAAIRFVLLFLAAAVPGVSVAVPGEPATITANVAVKAMVEAPELDDIALSPDGEVVVYSVLKRSITTNEITRTLYVQQLGVRADLTQVGKALSTRRAERTPPAFHPTWLNGSNEVLIAEPTHGVMRLNVRTGLQTAVQALDENGTLRPFVLPVPPDQRLYVSPRGTYLAFVAPSKRRSALDPRRGVLIGPDKPWVWDYDRLCLLDLRSGKVTTVIESGQFRVTPVGSLSWAPDESAVVFSADTDEDPRTYDGSNLFVAELATRSVRALVQQPGMDFQPSWSPDGKWIAFRGQRGEEWGPSELAVVPAAGGAVAYLTKDARYNAYPSAYSWSFDGRAVLYAASEQMTYRIYRAVLPDASAAAGPPVQVVEDVAGFTGSKGGWYLYAVSFSRDGRRVVFARGQEAGAQELHVADLVDGRVVSSRKISQLAAANPLAQHVRAEAVSWRSHDGKFTVHAVLVTPKAAWRDNRLTQALPTLVNMKGHGAGSEWRDAFEASPLAARGYAVLIPQVRGRGGNGVAFARGLRDARSYIRVPMEDVFAGLDQLIGQKISDRDRLGIYGISQGGTQAVGIATMTDRFKAAVSWEAHSDNKFVDSIIVSNSAVWRTLLPDNQANGDVYDPQERDRLETESVALNLHRVHTPTLLLFGAQSYAPTVGRIMQGGLARFGVPSEFIVYDEGHGFERPAAFYDAQLRTAAWFDYWLRDLPYPDAVRAAEYDRWKAARYLR